MRNEGQNVAQIVYRHAPVKVGIIRSRLHGGCICSLVYFLFQPMVHNWFIKGPVCGKSEDPLLLIGKSSLCGECGFCLKKYATMTICLISNSRWYDYQCALEALLNKTNFPFYYMFFPIVIAFTYRMWNLSLMQKSIYRSLLSTRGRGAILFWGREEACDM